MARRKGASQRHEIVQNKRVPGSCIHPRRFRDKQRVVRLVKGIKKTEFDNAIMTTIRFPGEYTNKNVNNNFYTDLEFSKVRIE